MFITAGNLTRLRTYQPTAPLNWTEHLHRTELSVLTTLDHKATQTISPKNDQQAAHLKDVFESQQPQGALLKRLDAIRALPLEDVQPVLKESGYKRIRPAQVQRIAKQAQSWQDLSPYFMTDLLYWEEIQALSRFDELVRRKRETPLLVLLHQPRDQISSRTIIKRLARIKDLDTALLIQVRTSKYTRDAVIVDVNRHALALKITTLLKSKRIVRPPDRISYDRQWKKQVTPPTSSPLYMLLGTNLAHQDQAYHWISMIERRYPLGQIAKGTEFYPDNAAPIPDPIALLANTFGIELPTPSNRAPAMRSYTWAGAETLQGARRVFLTSADLAWEL